MVWLYQVGGEAFFPENFLRLDLGGMGIAFEEKVMSQILSAKGVSVLLGRCEKWVYKHQHEIPGRFTIGKSIFWNEKVLLQAIEEMSKPKPPPRGYDGSGRHGL